jgi:hypothetical protein
VLQVFLNRADAHVQKGRDLSIRAAGGDVLEHLELPRRQLGDALGRRAARNLRQRVLELDFKVSKLYGMLPAEVEGDAQARTPAHNQTVRNVFVSGPDKNAKLILVYPMTTGRNFDEVLRVLDSLQLIAKHKVATPVNWQQGDDVIIAGSVSNDEAKELFGDWEEPRPYIRVVPQPREVASLPA